MSPYAWSAQWPRRMVRFLVSVREETTWEEGEEEEEEEEEVREGEE